MEARTEAEEDNNSRFWVCDDSLDDLFDHCHGEDDTQSMGSIQHTRHFKGKKHKKWPSSYFANMLFSPPAKNRSKDGTRTSPSSIIQTRPAPTNLKIRRWIQSTTIGLNYQKRIKL